MQRIFIVEDEDNIRELVSYALRSSGYDVTGFECAQPFRQRLRAEMPDLVLLDIMLPNEDGISILQSLKQNRQTARLPVIMLTAKSAEYDRIKGLDAGADDYIAKPFSVLELIARIRAVLRRGGGETPQKVINLGDIVLDNDKRTVYAGGTEAPLTYKEFELLQYLLQNRDIVLTRDQILTKIWGYEYDGYTNRTVDMHIKTLRRKLGGSGEQIKTVRGLGYKVTDGD